MSSTAARRLGLTRIRPASRVTAQAARSAIAGFRVRRAMARVSGSWARRAVTANSSAALSTRAGFATDVLGVGLRADASVVEPRWPEAPLVVACFAVGAFAVAALRRRGLRHWFLRRGCRHRRLDRRAPDRRRPRAPRRTLSETAPATSSRRTARSGADAGERAPPAHAVAAATNATKHAVMHESRTRRLPLGNGNQAPGEDASTIADGWRALKCGDPDCDEKGDSGWSACIRVPCATRCTRAPKEAIGCNSAAVRTPGRGTGSLQMGPGPMRAAAVGASTGKAILLA